MDKPTFLPPEVALKPLDGHYPEMPVEELANLPRGLKKKYPDGFVIKESNADVLEMSANFGGQFKDAADVYFAEQELAQSLDRKPTNKELAKFIREQEQGMPTSRLSGINAHRVKFLRELLRPESIAKFLRQRQKFLQEQFSDVLPDLVIESQFIVGQTAQNPAPHVYEIQRKIPIKVDLTRYLLSDFPNEKNPEKRSRSLVHDIVNSYDAEKIKRIKTELRLLADKIEYIHDRYGLMVDVIGWENLSITTGGALALIDTDKLLDEEVAAKEAREAVMVLKKTADLLS